MRPLLLLLALSLIGCVNARTAAWNTTPEQIELPSEQRAELLAEAESAWAERDEAEATTLAIELYTRALQADVSDFETWTQLSRAFHFQADCHIRFQEDSSELHETFNRGAQAAEQALVAQSDDFAERVRAGTRVSDAMVALGRESAPALYWRSRNMWRWSEKQGYQVQIEVRDEARALMSQSVNYQRHYDHSGIQRFFGEHYASAPPLMGRDLPRAGEYFSAAVQHDADYLENMVQFARVHDVRAEDRASFERRLGDVVDAEVAANQDAPENRCAQRKAAWLLDRSEELFN